METKILYTLTCFDDWLKHNNLNMNIEKTKIINFSYVDKDLDMAINWNDNVIQSEQSAMFLGIVLDGRLDWRSHIDYLSGKAGSYIFALKVLTKAVNVEAALISYFAYLESRFRYGIIFWGTSVDINRVFIMQKKCIRNIFGMKTRDSCRPVFVQKEILTMFGLYILEASGQMNTCMILDIELT